MVAASERVIGMPAYDSNEHCKTWDEITKLRGLRDPAIFALISLGRKLDEIKKDEAPHSFNDANELMQSVKIRTVKGVVHVETTGCTMESTLSHREIHAAVTCPDDQTKRCGSCILKVLPETIGQEIHDKLVEEGRGPKLTTWIN